MRRRKGAATYVIVTPIGIALTSGGGPDAQADEGPPEQAHAFDSLPENPSENPPRLPLPRGPLS